MAIMFGNGVATPKSTGTVSRTIMARVIDAATDYIDYIMVDLYNSATGSSERVKVDMKETTTARANMILFSAAVTRGLNVRKVTGEDGTVLGSASDTATMGLEAINTAIASKGGQKVLIDYTVPADKSEIIISGDTFPGTYYVQGDTYARSDVDGSDQFFQFIIPKAKMTSENTITLEAEGDPAVFNMNLTVLRPEDGDMMKLVQYDLK
jgi:hypothetical protein